MTDESTGIQAPVDGTGEVETNRVPIRVLILEDRPEDAELMVHELRRSWYAPVWRRLETEADYLLHLQSPPDVILADYRMPRLDAPRALELLRERDLDIPFIVVSGAIGEDAAVAIMRNGATDYLLKDRLRRLGPAVRRALDEKRLREDKRKTEQALRASETRFYSFMSNNPALAFIKDQDGRILYINNTCERAWGMTLAVCEGKLDADLWPPADAARLRQNDLAVLQRGEPSRMIEDLALHDGRVLQMLSFRFPFADGAGRRLLGGVSVDITDQMRIERALAGAVAAKEVLVKEVHHRVKNNLQIISSLLNMQAEVFPDPALRLALEESQRRVECMAMIHERLYSQEDIARLDFREYIASLARDLFYAYRGNSNLVRLRLECDPVSLELNQAIPCGLILNELVSNSLKYAFPEGREGEISIALSRDEKGVVTLRVADNGIGLPGRLDAEQSQSLGLRIVEILTRQLAGTLRHEAGPGADFCLKFEIAAPSANQEVVPSVES